MKLSIFGRHPVPQGGFNGVMSLFEAIEFSRLGYETTLLIPFADRATYGEFTEHNKLKDLDELPRFGGHFAIKAIFPDGENFEPCDVLIHQSYALDDWQNFEKLCRSKARLWTKNYPKFVPSPDAVYEGPVRWQFDQFDLVACALREDIQFITSNSKFAKERAGRYCYAPRGASPALLHGGYKAALPPTIGFDVPNEPEDKALEHFFEPIARLRRDFPDLNLLSIGQALPELGTEVVPYGRFDLIYENFFNRIHLYCTINYEHSPSHIKARIQSEAPEWRRRAVYEVQNIEAQMSGAVLIGHRDNIIAELYEPGITGFNFPRFDSPNEIYRTLKHALEHRAELGANARNFARRYFSWDRCIKLWSDGIQARMLMLDRKPDMSAAGGGKAPPVP